MNILVCCDGSHTAENAARLAALIAAGCNASITLLGIVEAPGKTDGVLGGLRRGLQLLEEKHIRAESITVTGEPIAEIVKRTEQAHFDLVVIGGTRKGARGLFWISSKAYKIIKRIHPPVLVVLEKTTRIKRILVCTGGRKYIAKAVVLTGEIARGMGAPVTLLHVMPEPPPVYSRLYHLETNVDTVLGRRSELSRNLLDQKKILEEMGVPVEVRLRQGSVLSQIQREIKSGNYDLVVAGSSLNQRGLRTYILGDVTREIVNRTTCAVLVVRSREPREGLLQNFAEWLDRLGHKDEKTTDVN